MYEEYNKDPYGHIIIEVKDDIWTVIGSHDGGKNTLHRYCTQCLANQIFEYKFHIWKNDEITKYIHACDVCHCHARAGIPLYFDLTYADVVDIISKNGGSYTRKDGMKFRFVDRLLASIR